MPLTSEAAPILLVQPDPAICTRLAAGLRDDGMTVVEYASPEQALLALSGGLEAAVLITVSAAGRLTDSELAEQAQDASPRLEIILTPRPGVTLEGLPPNVHVLPKPFEANNLSRFIRHVAARPSLRSALQRQYRQSKSHPAAVR